MSSILFASDLHGNADAYDALFAMDADAIVLGGDLLPYPLKRGGDLIDIQRSFVTGYLAPKLDTRRCFWILGRICSPFTSRLQRLRRQERYRCRPVRCRQDTLPCGRPPA